MDKNIEYNLNILEKFKDQMTDQEYKTAIEYLGELSKDQEELKKIKTGDVKNYVVIFTYLGGEDGEVDDDYPLKLTQKQRLLLRSHEFNNFVESDVKSKVFTSKEFLKKLIFEIDADTEHIKFLMYGTIIKLY